MCFIIGKCFITNFNFLTVRQGVPKKAHGHIWVVYRKIIYAIYFIAYSN